MKQITKEVFSNSIKWKIINLIMTKGVSFIVSVIIARLISPENYGYMAIWSVILAFCDVVIIGGADTVLIQKKNLCENDVNAVLLFCFFKAIVLSFVIILIAPYIAKFFCLPELTALTRMLIVDFVSQPLIMLGNIRSAREMNYKAMFFSDLLSTFAGALFSLLAAYTKNELYVLSINNMVHQLLFGVLMSLYWRKKIHICFNLKNLFKILIDGLKTMSNSLLDLITSTINGLFIGKWWNAIDVGYYNRAQSLTQILGVESYNVISNILLPTFSSYQDDVEKLKIIARKVVSISTYVMFPLMFGVLVCSKEIILILFTDKWLDAVHYLEIGCIYYAFNPIRQLCMNINYSLAKYKENNMIESIRLMLSVSFVLIYLFIELDSLVGFAVLGSTLSIIVAVMYLDSIRKAICYTWNEIIKDIVPNFLLSLVSLIPCLIISGFIQSSILSLFCSVMASTFIYLLLSYLADKDELFLVSTGIKVMIRRIK